VACRDREQRDPAYSAYVACLGVVQSGYRGWVQAIGWSCKGWSSGPVPLFARWCPNSVGESTILASALEAHRLPVTELLLGDSTFGVLTWCGYAQQGGWLLTPNNCPPLPHLGNMTSMLIDAKPLSALSANYQACDLKTCPAKGLARAGVLSSPVLALSKSSFSLTIVNHRPFANIKGELSMKLAGRIAA